MDFVQVSLSSLDDLDVAAVRDSLAKHRLDCITGLAVPVTVWERRRDGALLSYLRRAVDATADLESDLLSVALRPGANPRVFPTPRDQEVIASVVDAYRALYRPDGMSSVTWPPELFFTSNPGEGRQKEILLAGDARVLIRGPYCALPAGNWRLAVEFEVVDHVSGDSVEADVVCGYGAETLARGLFVLPERGIFRYSLDFVLDEPKSGFETRLRMLKSAIRGVLCLRKVTATRPDAAEERRAQTAGADDANIYNADDDGSVVRAPLSER